MNPLQNSSKMKIKQLIYFWLNPNRIFPNTSLKQSDSTQFLQAKSAILNTDSGVSPILPIPFTNICITSTLPLGVFISSSLISFLSAVSAQQSAMILLLICTSSPLRVTLLICSQIFLFLSQSYWMRLFCLMIFSFRIFTTSLQSSIDFGYFYIKLYIQGLGWDCMDLFKLRVGISEEGEGQLGWDAEGLMGSQAIRALFHFFEVSGKGLVGLLADLFVLADLLLLLASSLEVLRALFEDVAAGFDGLVGSDRLHCWDLYDVVLEVNRGLWGDFLILSDQLFAFLFFFAFGLLTSQGILTSIGELMQIELLIDNLPSEGKVILVSELLIDKFQLLIVGLANLDGLPVKLLKEVFLNFSCNSIGIREEVQVILEQFLLFFGLVLPQSQLLTGQNHILCQGFPVALSDSDLLFGMLRALLELTLGVALEILQFFPCGFEDIDGQVAMSAEHVMEFCFFGLDLLQICFFWWILANVFLLPLFSLFLLIPYTLDGVQLFQPFLL